MENAPRPLLLPALVAGCFLTGGLTGYLLRDAPPTPTPPAPAEAVVESAEQPWTTVAQDAGWTWLEALRDRRDRTSLVYRFADKMAGHDPAAAWQLLADGHDLNDYHAVFRAWADWAAPGPR